MAAVALEALKAIGSSTALTIVSGYVAAAEFVFIRHTGIASTEAGAYKVQIRYRIKNQ